MGRCRQGGSVERAEAGADEKGALGALRMLDVEWRDSRDGGPGQAADLEPRAPARGGVGAEDVVVAFDGDRCGVASVCECVVVFD